MNTEELMRMIIKYGELKSQSDYYINSGEDFRKYKSKSRQLLDDINRELKLLNGQIKHQETTILNLGGFK